MNLARDCCSLALSVVYLPVPTKTDISIRIELGGCCLRIKYEFAKSLGHYSINRRAVMFATVKCITASRYLVYLFSIQPDGVGYMNSNTR